MQITVMCPECARLLTVKINPPDDTSAVCPTCGWKGTIAEDGTMTTTED